MLLEILFQEFGKITRIETVPLKANRLFSQGDYVNTKQENELPNIIEDSWINSWQLINTIDQFKQIFTTMLVSSTQSFLSEKIGWYRPINKDPNSKFIINIIDENFIIRDDFGRMTDKTTQQIVKTFEIDGSKCTFTAYSMLKNVSETGYQTLFNKVFSDYWTDFTTITNNTPTLICGMKTIFENFFSPKIKYDGNEDLIHPKFDNFYINSNPTK